MANMKDLSSGKILKIESVGSSTSELMGFWGAAPVVQPSGAGQAAVSSAVTTTATTTNLKTTMASVVALINQLRSDLTTAGLIKGAA